MYTVLDVAAAGVAAIITLYACRYAAHVANRAKPMSKRAIICFCGKAKPCERSDCQHSTAIAKRNEAIRQTNSMYRVKKAHEALAALQGDEWSEVMRQFCRDCGGSPDCCCMRED